MTKNKEEILNAAIKLEKDGRKFYLDAAAKAQSANARTMFESLAGEEVQHMQWTEQLEPGAGSSAKINRDLYNQLKKIFSDAPEAVQRSAQLAKSDSEAIDLAIDIEVKSWKAYEAWGKESDDEDVCRLCDILADAERFHRDLLINSKEYLDHTADWFTTEEHWSFDGG